MGARTCARGLLPALVLFASCAETSGGAPRPQGPRAGADDNDLWNLVPGDTDAVVDVDLAALRASPWSSALMQGDLDGDRDERRGRFGYDVFTEAERMVVAGTEVTGGTNALTIARGRFDAERVGGAFVASAPGVVATQWRQSPLWEGQGRELALVTPRTIVHGDSQRVRAAVDASWGVVADVGAGPLGALRRTLDADRNPPAVTFAVTVTEGMRARAAGVLSVPDGLLRIGARLNLGQDLDLDGLALFDSGGHAATAASVWADAARTYARQQMVMLLGLTPVFDGLKVAAEGSRVHVRLHIGAERREGLAEKLLAVLQALAKNRK
jgi:hypothetical protein